MKTGFKALFLIVTLTFIAGCAWDYSMPAIKSTGPVSSQNVSSYGEVINPIKEYLTYVNLRGISRLPSQFINHTNNVQLSYVASGLNVTSVGSDGNYDLCSDMTNTTSYFFEVSGLNNVVGQYIYLGTKKDNTLMLKYAYGSFQVYIYNFVGNVLVESSPYIAFENVSNICGVGIYVVTENNSATLFVAYKSSYSEFTFVFNSSFFVGGFMRVHTYLYGGKSFIISGMIWGVKDVLGTLSYLNYSTFRNSYPRFEEHGLGDKVFRDDLDDQNLAKWWWYKLESPKAISIANSAITMSIPAFSAPFSNVLYSRDKFRAGVLEWYGKVDIINQSGSWGHSCYAVFLYETGTSEEVDFEFVPAYEAVWLTIHKEDETRHTAWSALVRLDPSQYHLYKVVVAPTSTTFYIDDRLLFIAPKLSFSHAGANLILGTYAKQNETHSGYIQIEWLRYIELSD